MNADSILSPRLIRASAGTGKTRDLSSRYIGLLALGESPDKILATTFTRKAAGEIRERVFSRLAQAARDPKLATDLGESIGRGHFSMADARQLLVRLADQQHRLLITTLDSLFISIARSFALELGLPADWRIASTRDHALLKEEAVRLLFEENNRAVALEMVRSLHGGALSRSVHTQVTGDVSKLYNLYLFSDRSAWDWVVVPPTPAAEITQSFADRLEAFRTPVTKAGEPDKHWHRALEGLRRSVRNRDWTTFSKNGLVSKVLGGETQFSRREIDPDAQELVLWAREEAKRDTSIQLKLQLRALYDMLQTYHKCYTESQRRLGILSFDDVKQHLARSAVLGELDHIYYRLDSRISHLLLDEFQDTSMTEWRVIQPIADEILSQTGQHSFFCVGDMKQAIYGWRGGVAEIFGTIERRWPLLQPESKQTTYRCSPAVIECVNRLFLSLERLPCLERQRSSVTAWCARFEEHHAARTMLEGGVELHLVADDGPGLLPTAAALVSELQKQYPEASIGVLVRKNETVSSILEEFSRLETPVEVSEEGGTSLTDSAVVRSMLSLLRYLDHPSDTLARFHVDQTGISELFEVPAADDGELLLAWQEKLRTDLLYRGYGAVLSGWSRQLFPRCRARDQVRLRQLIDLAYIYDPNRTLCADDFIAFISGEKVELPSEAMVRVMTFHKAKGLEFDIVVLPELGGKISPHADGILTRRLSPVDSPLRISPGKSKFVRSLIPELEEMYQDAERATVSEALSVLYVGLTRARQGMHMLIPESERAGSLTMSRILREAFPISSARELLAGTQNWRFNSGGSSGSAETQITLCEKPIVFQQRSSMRRENLARISPSQRSERFRLKSAGEAELSREARLRGIALHRLLEQIEWIEDLDAQVLDYQTLIGRVGLSADSMQRAEQQFKDLVSMSALREQLSRARFSPEHELTLFREHSFALRRDQQLVVGAIDRLVIECVQGRAVQAEIIDFKSDRVSASGMKASEKAERYREQIEHYCHAARQFVGEEIEVSGKILFLDTLETVRLV